MNQPISEQTAIRFNADLPEAGDVVIIGGGVIGVFAALYLARRGKRVVLCEKGRIAGEQSSRNWGWIRQQGRDPAELPIMTEALRLWREVSAQTGENFGFRKAGVSYLASTQDELARLETWLDVARDQQLDTRALTGPQIDTIIDHPAGGHKWVGGIITPSDCCAEPWLAVPAVAELAQSEGVIIRENCAVRGLDIASGQVAGVVTEAGTVRCEQVVLAGGAWSSLFARRHGVKFPQLSVHSTAASTAPLPDFSAGCAADEDLAFRRRQDGAYTLALGDTKRHYIGPDSLRNLKKYLPVLGQNAKSTTLHPAAPAHYPDAWGTGRKWDADRPGPFEAMRVLDPAPNPRVVAKLQSNFARRFPNIGKPAIATSWAGMIDTMPDLVPVVDRAPSLPGLIIATGMSGHGFGIGPGFGKIIASIACSTPTGHDISRFRFLRFSDGSKLNLGPSL